MRLVALVVVVCVAQSTWAAESSVIQRYGLQEAAKPIREGAGWQKPKIILVSGLPPGIVRELQSVAPGVQFIDTRSRPSMDDLAKVDAVIGVCVPELLAAGPSIRWIQVLNNGVESCVSIPALRERKVLLTNMQRIGGDVIAEHAVAMLLALARGLDVYVKHQASGSWSYAEGRTITVASGKTVLVVGLGGIGSEVAKRAHALGLRVIATRASGHAGPDYVSYIGLPEELPKLVAQADFVVNTVPLTAATTGLFDAALFARMKPGAYFINVARGRSVVTDALVAALREHKLAGAGLDVTDPEPLPSDHPLWRLPNVIITPHVSGDSDLGYEAITEVVKENVRRYVAGDRMLSVVDVERGY
jgi:phosphoglycerate dehydrogenase-like enzyme